MENMAVRCLPRHRGSLPDLAQLRKRLYDPGNLHPSLHRADQNKSTLAADRLWREVHKIPWARFLIDGEPAASMLMQSRHCSLSSIND